MNVYFIYQDNYLDCFKHDLEYTILTQQVVLAYCVEHIYKQISVNTPRVTNNSTF